MYLFSVWPMEKLKRFKAWSTFLLSLLWVAAITPVWALPSGSGDEAREEAGRAIASTSASSTPPHRPGVALQEMTPGQRLAYDQAQVLVRERFVAVLGPEFDASWSVDWDVLADAKLAHDAPQKLSNIHRLMNKLKNFLRTYSFNPQFMDLYVQTSVIKDRMESVYAERLESVTQAYFTQLFPGAEIKFDAKDEGVQLGLRATVHAEDGQRMYYVKTHSAGRLASKSTAAKRVDPKELLVYKFLEYQGLGCESHFFQRSPEDVYIATLDAGYQGEFYVFEQAVRSEAEIGEVIWGALSMTKNSPRENSPEVIQRIEKHVDEDAIAQKFLQNLSTMDIISRIFRLRDFLNNGENFGFYRVKGGPFVPRVIDFRLDDDTDRALDERDFSSFLCGNGKYNYLNAHRVMRYGFRDRPREQRVEQAKFVLTLGPLHSIEENIQRAYEAVCQYIQNNKIFSTPQADMLDELTKWREILRGDVQLFRSHLEIGE